MWIAFLNNWKPIAIVLALLLSHGWVYRHGQAVVEAEQERAIARQHENNLKVNAEVSHEYQSKITALRKRYDALVRLHSASGVRIPATANGVNGSAGANQLHGCMGDVMGYTLMLSADIQTQQLISLQEWIRKQSK